MTGANGTPAKQWTVKQAILLAALCLTIGIAGGWSIRASQSPAPTGPANVLNVSAGVSSPPASQAPGRSRLKEMANAQAASLLDKLKSDPADPELLISIGNIYYDAQQYPIAIDFYGRALKATPSDAAVRTDMATAYWYMGDADSAIAEFNKALSYAPNNPNTLFNLGVVKWKGKVDAAGAIADWKTLLAAHPNYEGKDQVQQMMAEAKKQAATRP
jgi:cytochrome c-type biogenesis protein CcmH/NrfG